MLYYWDSEYTADYSNGYIIVEANSVQEARTKAINAFDAHYRERFHYWNFPGTLDATEDDVAHYAEYKEKFMSDMAAEPTELADGLIFIRGGE